MTGGAGNDYIIGNTGADTIVGAQNDKVLDGGGGTDTLNVGANFTSTSDAQIVNIENVTLTAASTLNLSNQTEGFTITGSSGVDLITAGSGNDTIVGAVNDTLLDGGGGTDTLNVGASFTSTSDAQIVNIENVTLTASGLTLNLGNQTEGFTITGLSGANTITGGSAPIPSPAAPATTRSSALRTTRCSTAAAAPIPSTSAPTSRAPATLRSPTSRT